MFVYNGFSEGLRTVPSQIIAQINSRAFGSSLSTLRGTIGIGDFQSDQINLYHLNPSMRIEAYFKRMNLTALGRPGTRSNGDLDCSLGANCWQLCIKFDGEGIPEKHHFSIESDLDKMVGRIRCKNYGHHQSCLSNSKIEIREVYHVHR